MTRSRGTSRGTTRGGSSTARQPASSSTAEDGSASASASLPSSAAPTTTRGTSSGGRFRPKAIRRDEADRDELARREAQKASERAAEELRARGRSRLRSRRSRGDAMGSRGRGISTAASGPFSGGFHGASSSSGSFRTGSSSNAGPFTAGSRANSDTKFSTSQTSRRETRINADKLHAMTPTEELDSDDEAMRAALSALPSSSALPMGIYRREHKDAGIVVATTAELEAAEQATGDEPSLWVDGDGRTGLAQKPESGNWHPKAKNN
ncbi:hypothetical protein CDD80_6341 [Ophiocordyceps camponoti-rufipedis]|uniref:Uncharacterized protein n=1 Tax=Ophiocordyceps camponoti-rufipedis TaxID=2004952 RepID=A0A2C5YMF2_9HYPO|nr:hypothetical protein CDD80_6341 [Ophiocordyceps camponoti-rufipedis]